MTIIYSRIFELQIQGKFKKLPVGEVYIGAECRADLNMGFLVRTFAKGVMKFAGSMVSTLHYSFGDDSTSKDDKQFPHVCGRLYSAMDKFIVSRPGEPIPPLGSPFIEDFNHREARVKTKTIRKAEINLDNIYSFSVYSDNLDLSTWSIIGVPMLSTMNINSILGEADIYLVMYELPKSEDSETNFAVPHICNQLKYMMTIKVLSISYLIYYYCVVVLSNPLLLHIVAISNGSLGTKE
jgi:hypothetical protein